MASLTVLADDKALVVAATERIATLVAESIRARGSAVVSLTGGSTPRHVYALLADPAQRWRARIDWSRVHLFWGDERHVPPDHSDSNYGMAHETLLAHVPIPQEQVHRMRGELDPGDAAVAYEASLREGFQKAGRSDATFDLMLLGLGEDAHIASLFPRSPLLSPPPATGRAAALRVPHLDTWRITMTPQALLDARRILVVVSGEQKADAVRAALEEPDDVQRWPAQLLRAATDRVEWITDRAAAGRLRDARPA